MPVRLCGEHGARLDRLAVEQHRAGAAGCRLAADVGRGEVRHVAQEVHEQHAVLDVRGDVLAVDGQFDLHFALAFWIAVQTRSGVVGMSMCRTPRCESASITAFCTAGVAPMVPASPMPLTPSGFSVVGVSLVTSSKLGSSAAVIAA